MKEIDDKDYDAVVICGHKNDNAPWDDNLYGNCLLCDAEIMWRPHSPSGPRVARVCPPCGFENVARMKERGEAPEMVVTEKSKQEIRELMGAKRPDSFFTVAFRDK